MKKLIFTLGLLFSVTLSWGQINENFDGLSESSYGNYTYNGFQISNGLCNSENARSGNAIRLRNASTSLEYVGSDGNGKDGGVGTISFWYRAWDASPTCDYTVEVNINGGGYNTIGSINTSSTTYQEFSYDLNNTSDNILIKITRNSGERLHIDDFSITDYTVSGSEISIEGNNIEILDGDTTPDTVDHTDFGNVEVTGGSQAYNFTIKNTGNTDLNINSVGSNNADFVISGISTPLVVSASNETTFTVTFDPSATGTSTATITIDNDDSDESTYDFLAQGNGTNSASSDIITNTGFAYTVNIPYLDYQNDPITSTSGSVGVFKFDIRDGGGSADADALSTELTDITFSVGAAHGNYIRSAALFDGNTQLANNATIDNATGNISFSGLSGADYTATDDNTKSLTLRVSFTTTVTDKEQLQFTITSATANNNGSVFATANAGGAQSAVTGDKNRIDVIATALAFDQQPTNTDTNSTMTPAVTVKGVDVNNILDKDFSDDVSLSSSGTMTGDPITVSSINGVGTFDNIVHTAPGAGLVLTASHSSFTSVTSDSFDIVDFTFEAGDYRTTTPGVSFSANNNAGDTNNWEYFDGTSWGATPDDNAPQNATTTPGRIIIDHTNVDAAGSASHTYNDIIVRSGGELYITDDDNNPTDFIDADKSLEINEGGKIFIQGDIQLNSSANFILRNGAYMTIDQNSMVNDHPMWNGIELFEGGSTVEIIDWDWTASATVRSLINVVTTIHDNANGYKFGKVYLNPTNPLPENWTIVGGPVNVKVTENDFQINNTSSDKYVAVMSNKNAGISATFGGDIVVDDGPFTFGSSYSTDDFDQTIIIKGDMLIASDDDVYLHKTFNGTPSISAGDGQIKIEGNIEVWQMASNILDSDVDTKQILLTGNNTHTIYINRNCSNMPLIIEEGDTAILTDADLKFAGHSSLTIKDGATFNFGFNGTTALEIQNVSGSVNEFIQEGGAYLYITHPQGIWDASNNGNVQDFSASNTTYTQSGSTYHYVGKENQETGDAFTSGSTSKTIICELENNTDELTVTATTGTSSLLEIRKGIVINTDSNHIEGSGDLTISDGGLKTSVLGSTGNVPLLSGNFNITGGFIELNASDDQTLKGSNDYKDLIFSNAGTKTVSSAISNIDGTITIRNNAIVDVESHTMGGAGTNITMEDTAEYITAGIGVKPDAQGTYNLGIGTKMSFTHDGSTMQKIRLFKDYYNIDVFGNNVGTETLTTPIRIQTGGTFTVKTNATFKLNNTTGFNGGIETAIDNTNTPTITLEAGSTIEYTGSTQSISNHTPGYQNLIISGTDTKTLGDVEILINENLSVNAATLSVEDDKSIKIAGNITNDGAILIANKGGLVQTDDNASIGGTGTFQLNKTSLPLNNYWEYVYWSSPINSSAFTMEGIVSGAWRYYKFDPNEANNGNTYPGWVMLSATDTPAKGIGYAISAPTGAATNTILNPQFISGNDPFNNGEITINILKKGGPDNIGDFNLLGNPYPSAIDFHALIDDADNSNLVGAYSLWTNCEGLDANGHHQDSGYTTYSYSGGSGTATAACSGSGSSAGQYIATGQGFMIEASTDNSTMKFKNAYRVSNNNDGFLNRNLPRNIVWVDMLDGNGKFNQIAVGFYPNATDAYDRLFDASSMNTGNGYALYSILGNKKLAIQGLPELSGTDKVIPLGIESDIARTITLHINHTEGLANEYIYVRDLYLNIIHDLKASDYTTTVNTGNIDDRFELIFTQQAMRINDVIIDPNAVLLTQQSGAFNLTSNNDMHITSVTVYDITGKVLYNNKDIDTTSHQIDLQRIATGNMLVFRVQMNHESVVIKKAIKQ